MTHRRREGRDAKRAGCFGETLEQYTLSEEEIGRMKAQGHERYIEARRMAQSAEILRRAAPLQCPVGHDGCWAAACAPNYCLLKTHGVPDWDDERTTP